MWTDELTRPPELFLQPIVGLARFCIEGIMIRKEAESRNHLDRNDDTQDRNQVYGNSEFNKSKLPWTDPLR